jgi:HEAT repeat protein
VQRKAVEALAALLPQPEAVAALAAFVARDDTEPYVRGAAAFRLARLGDRSTSQVLSEAWRAERQPWRIAPLALAAALMGDTEALSPLSAALARGDVALETEFLSDLGDSGLTELVPSLREGASWVEPEMMLPFAAAQVALGDPSGEALFRRALADPEEEVQLEALDYLSRMNDPTALALLRKASTEESDLVRSYAVLALAGRGEAPAERFERAMVDTDREIRLLAVRFAVEAAREPMSSHARRAERAARRVVRLALADPDLQVRTEALRAVASLGLHSEQASLAVAQVDDDLSIRIEAAGASLLLAASVR